MKILWICSVWPEPDSSAAGTRTFQLLNGLRERGFDVSVSSGCKDNSYREVLGAKGIPTVFFNPNDSAFDEYLKSTQPDTVIFDRFMIEEQFSWRVRQQLPEALRILDTVDLHSLRRARQRIASQGLSNEICVEVPDAELVGDDFLREIASIFRSDLTLMVSDAEIEFLISRCGVPRSQLTRCSLLYPKPGDVSSFNKRSNFIAIGNCNHPPNMDGFDVLSKVVWPQIARSSDMAGVELHLYGAYPNHALLAMKNPTLGIVVHGKASDAVTSLSQYRVNLAPLRFGAGVKGKIADGWFAGTPCVATSIGAEGMTGSFPFGGYVENSWVKFAERAVDLYRNEIRWNEAQQAGLSVLRDMFAADSQLLDLTTALNTTLRDKAAIRAKNVVGEILWREQNRSTEFFSRWIEAKNRR